MARYNGLINRIVGGLTSLNGFYNKINMVRKELYHCINSFDSIMTSKIMDFSKNLNKYSKQLDSTIVKIDDMTPSYSGTIYTTLVDISEDLKSISASIKDCSLNTKYGVISENELTVLYNSINLDLPRVIKRYNSLIEQIKNNITLGISKNLESANYFLANLFLDLEKDFNYIVTYGTLNIYGNITAIRSTCKTVVSGLDTFILESQKRLQILDYIVSNNMSYTMADITSIAQDTEYRGDFYNAHVKSIEMVTEILPRTFANIKKNLGDITLDAGGEALTISDILDRYIYNVSLVDSAAIDLSQDVFDTLGTIKSKTATFISVIENSMYSMSVDKSSDLIQENGILDEIENNISYFNSFRYNSSSNFKNFILTKLSYMNKLKMNIHSLYDESEKVYQEIYMLIESLTYMFEETQKYSESVDTDTEYVDFRLSEFKSTRALATKDIKKITSPLRTYLSNQIPV